MAIDPRKAGSDWDDGELDLIVADYFVMLNEELTHRPYVKRRHGLALQDRIGRPHKSLEFKHMNISAVLVELGLPTIAGYRPMANYQKAIIGAVERYLLSNPMALFPEAIERPLVGFAETPAAFVESPPSLRPPAEKLSGLDRIVRKFDPVERDFRNRKLGRAGEDLIVSLERGRLHREGRDDLARKIRWVSEEDGDGAGYDILSSDPGGRERLLEVKTTNGGNRTPFFLTRNERALSEERPDAFRIVRVFEFVKTPRLFELEPPLDHSVILTAENWRASFQ